MRRLTLILSLVLTLSLLCAARHAMAGEASSPEGAKFAERLENLPGLKNVGLIEDGLYRGAQPDDPDGYATLKEMGVKTVLNLRNRHSERDVVEAHGMKSVEIPMSMFSTPDVADVERAVEVMSDPELRPLYVHCALGEDRTGVVVAVYRMNKNGWSYDDAKDEMQAFGFNDIWVQLRHFLKHYAGEDDN